MPRISPKGLLYAFIVLISLYRLNVAQALPMSPDEAYYYAWSRVPAVCYYDQPGMVAWVNHLFALPFAAPSAFTMRIAAVALSALSTLLLFGAYREYRGDEAEAAVFAVAFSVLPFTWLLGFLMIHDSVFLPWLALTYWLIIRVVKREGQAADWIGLAVALAGAMYAKLSGFMAVWGLLIYMLLTPRGRRLFLSPWPYVAGIISTVLFLPAIVWNFQHDFATLQAVRELTDVGDLTLSRRAEYVAEYIASQVGIFSPLLGLTAFAALFKGVRRAVADPSEWEAVLPACLAAPVFAYFFIQSTSTHVFGNWPGVGYIPLAMLAAREIAETAKRGGEWLFRARFVALGMGLNIAIMVLFSLHLQFHLFRPLLGWIENKAGMKERIDWRLDLDFGGWDEMAALVEKHRPGTDFLLTRNYQVASMLEFMLPDRPRVECYSRGNRRENQWDLWSTLDKRIGQTALFVDIKRIAPEVAGRCDQLEQVADKLRLGGEKTAKRWTIYKCYGWKGPAPEEKKE